jgi:hypothetical protein
MENPQNNFKENARAISRMLQAIFGLFVVIGGMLVYLMVDPNLSAFKSKPETALVVPDAASSDPVDFDAVENGVHLRTGFVEGEGLMTVVNNCTNCHSAKLVTQNRMSREGWASTIRWMQETQNLWDLGKNEEIILNYLASYYAPEKKGRRQNLSNIQWYVLSE